MDPVLIKFIQLILAEILGGALTLAGVWLFVRGVSGKSNLLVQGAGVKAKLTNGAPGSIIAIIGLVVVVLSLNSTIDRTEVRSTTNATLVRWLTNSARITDTMNYGQVVDMIVGKDTDTRFTNKSIRLDKAWTLGELAQAEYNDLAFWRLLAAINKDRGYFVLSQASEKTVIPAGSFIEAWHLSIYDNLRQEDRIRVTGANRIAAYDELLVKAESGAQFNFSELTEQYRARELPLAYSQAERSGLATLRELSLKYYGNAKYWPLLVWANPGVFPKDANESTPLPSDRDLHVIHFVGWPR